MQIAVGAALGALVASHFGTFARIRGQRFPVGTFLRRSASGPKRISVWRRYAVDRAARSASGARVGSCLSSIRRSIDGNCSGTGNDRSVARKGHHNKQATGQQQGFVQVGL